MRGIVEEKRLAEVCVCVIFILSVFVFFTSSAHKFHSLLHSCGKAFDLIDDDDSGYITKSVSFPFCDLYT
jgi:hypothetical protein